MRTQSRLARLAHRLGSLLSATGLLALASCGSSPATITVQGHTLTVVETNYGKTDPTTNPTAFCNPLTDMGQFEVIISDFSLCTQVHDKASNATVFHSTDETNLRLILPSFLVTNPNGTFKNNTFTVGPTSFCSQNGSGAEAEAIFAHGSAMQTNYDVKVEASTGSITLTAYDGTSELKGTFDLTFATDHVTGSFDASYCSGLTASYGQ